MEIDRLTEQGVRKYLKENGEGLSVTVLETATSTNTLLRERALAGEAEGSIIIAASQTGGRGRMGRSFFSPENTGVYLSILLRPGELAPKDAVKITTMAAVAACEAAEEVSGRKALIKWVNDIFIDGKKTMGILTEAGFDTEKGSIDYAILGIGMNAYAPEGGFPDEIKDTAGAVLEKRISDGRNRLAAEFINRFFEYYRSGSGRYVSEYRNRSLVIGREIRVVSDGGSRTAQALDVDEDCHLLVKYEDGSLEKLSSGEISVRLN